MIRSWWHTYRDAAEKVIGRSERQSEPWIGDDKKLMWENSSSYKGFKCAVMCNVRIRILTGP